MTCLDFVIPPDPAEYDAAGAPVELIVEAPGFEFEVSSCP